MDIIAIGVYHKEKRKEEFKRKSQKKKEQKPRIPNLVWFKTNHLIGLEYINKLHILLSNHGRRLIVFMIPDRDQIMHPEFESVTESQNCWELSRTWLRNHKIEFVSPLQAMRKEYDNGNRLYFQEGHWNKAGHMASAKILFHHLLETD